MVAPNSPRSTVLRLSPEEERERLWDLPEKEVEKILLVSDLHLGIGRDPVTSAYWAWENFLADGAFIRWLASYPREEIESTLLVLNGDIVDFLRIVKTPRTRDEYHAWAWRLFRLGEEERARAIESLGNLPRELRDRARNPIISRSERRYGLRTDDYKTLWKLHLVIEGHVPFFEALGAWVTSGGRIVIVTGNHDVELYWPLIRHAIRDEVVERSKLSGKDREGAQIAFADSNFKIGNLHVEHGHMHEAVTRVDFGPVLSSDPTQIKFPLGSFVNRYLINRLERLDPFLDNVKPVNQALLALLRRRPLSILKAYAGGWKYIFRAWKMGLRESMNAATFQIGTLIFVPPLAIVLLALTFLFPRVLPDEVQRSLTLVRGILAGGGVVSALLPYILGAFQEIARQLGIFQPKDHYGEAALGILEREFPVESALERAYVIMGHTHLQQVRMLERRERRDYYVNTGTWVPLWPQKRPDLSGKVFHSVTEFQRIAGGEFRHRALIWDDQAGELRPAPMQARED